MKFIKIVIAIMLLVVCTKGAAADAAPAKQLVGTYVNSRPEVNNYLLLLKDGRGFIVSENLSGQLTLLMTFDWRTDGEHFYQTRIIWTADGKEFYRSHDDSTTYNYDGIVLQTQVAGTGEQIRWIPTKTDVFDKVRDAASRDLGR